MTVLSRQASEVTEVRELDDSEAHEMFDRRSNEELGVSGDVFLRAHAEGRYPADWDVAGISRLEMLLPFVS